MNFHGLNTAPKLIGIMDQVPPSSDVLFDRLRHHRNLLLAATDWTQVPDAACDQDAWALYRNALRDLPTKVSDPISVKWPEPPK